MKTKLIRLRCCPDVRAPKTHRDGQWHTGWRIEGSLRIAFHHARQWWIMPENGPVEGPFKSMEEALA